MSEDPPNPLPPPFDVPSVEEMAELLPQYAFEKLAAFGGMGAVYKATQKSLDRKVAIKILPPEFGSEPEFAERFKSEARAMAKMNHTSIVSVYDFGLTSGGHLYLVMEWVEGPTLHEIIHKGCIPARRAIDLGMQLCDALAYAHNRKTLHRDIKPGNIMVNDQGQVKVADFGLARPLTGEAEENPYGTPDYAAPEILNQGAVDQRVDIFAAGIVLYEMLTGRVPKTPRTSVTEYAPVSKRWDEVIDRAIHPEPEKRFQNAGELRSHLAALLEPVAEAVVVPVAEVVEANGASKIVIKPLHLVFGITAALVIGVVVAGMIGPEPKPKKKPAREQVENRSEDRPKAKKSADGESMPKPELASTAQEAQPAATTSEPELKPEKKKPKAEPPTVAMAEAPEPTAPAKAPLSPPPPEPVPENPLDAILHLEERDPELTQLIKAFAHEWAVNDAIDTEPEVAELAEKYIPALQRALAGLTPEHRDEVLGEISHIANRELPTAPTPSWPPVLHSLRKAYDGQLEVIMATAQAAAKQMRDAQCELVRAKAAERADAGQTEDAKRAEWVAEELARLDGAPSLRALKDAAGLVTGSALSPPAASSPGPR